METSFPYQYTMDSGTEVVVNKAGSNEYTFSLTPTDRPAQQFTYIEGRQPRAEWDQLLEFESLDALRRFWLKHEDIL